MRVVLVLFCFLVLACTSKPKVVTTETGSGTIELSGELKPQLTQPDTATVDTIGN